MKMKTSSILSFALSVIILANTIQAQQQYGIILFYNGFGTEFCRPNNVAVVYSFPNMTCYATQDRGSYIVSTLDNTLTITRYASSTSCASSSTESNTLAPSCSYGGASSRLSFTSGYASGALASSPFINAPYPNAQYFVATAGVNYFDTQTTDGPTAVYVFDTCIFGYGVFAAFKFRCNFTDNTISVERYGGTGGSDSSCSNAPTARTTISSLNVFDPTSAITVTSFGTCVQSATSTFAEATSTSIVQATSTSQNALITSTTNSVATSTSAALFTSTSQNSATTSADSFSTSSNSVATSTQQVATSTQDVATSTSILRSTTSAVFSSTTSALAEATSTSRSVSTTANSATTSANTVTTSTNSMATSTNAAATSTNAATTSTAASSATATVAALASSTRSAQATSTSLAASTNAIDVTTSNAYRATTNNVYSTTNAHSATTSYSAIFSTAQAQATALIANVIGGNIAGVNTGRPATTGPRPISSATNLLSRMGWHHAISVVILVLFLSLF
eukprot:TRINITY_DN1754_c0_g1_i1.p1 TRINITY_DN1754_c0_g1~~TRINITY_DN1754_c0_g1_i1.p1  ORF type:complete len:509 (+),score=77.67 TRINITY_DN1754_c0_g1_i1:66-1592(+)